MTVVLFDLTTATTVKLYKKQRGTRLVGRRGINRNYKRINSGRRVCSLIAVMEV